MSQENDQLQKEMNRGVLIAIEAPDRRVSTKAITVLETAVKYEFKGHKFIVVNPATCTELAANCQTLLQKEMYGASRLLIASTILSEAANVIRGYLDEGYNVLTSNYISDMVIEMVQYYNPDAVAAIIQVAELNVTKNSEIILMSPVREDEYHVNRLRAYHAFADAAIEDNSAEGNMTVTYRIDTSMEDIDDGINQIIEIIGSTLARQESLKDFANKLFAEPRPIEDDIDPLANEEDQSDTEPKVEE